MGYATGMTGKGDTPPGSDVRFHPVAVHRRVRFPPPPGNGMTAEAVLTEGKATMAESYNGYCVKCKDKRDFDGDIAETNGRRMAKGTCPVCGTRMNRILGKA
jgi:uncharacterized protein DUF5679